MERRERGEREESEEAESEAVRCCETLARFCCRGGASLVMLPEAWLGLVGGSDLRDTLCDIAEGTGDSCLSPIEARRHYLAATTTEIHTLPVPRSAEVRPVHCGK